MRRLLCTLLLAAGPAAAQAPVPEAPRSGALTWSASLGPSVMTQPLVVGVGVAVGVARCGATLEVGYEVVEELFGRATFNAASVRAGVAARSGPFSFGVSAGPAVVWGAAEYEPGRPLGERYAVPGATVAAHALYGWGPAVDVGLGAWANVNPRLSTAGTGLVLRLKGGAGAERRAR